MVRIQRIAALKHIIHSAEKLIVSLEYEPRHVTRRRRTSVEAEKMRANILRARAKGVPAKKLAEKYGVSTAYVYMIK